VEGVLGETGVAFAVEGGFAAFPEGDVGVHAGAVVRRRGAWA